MDPSHPLLPLRILAPLLLLAAAPHCRAGRLDETLASCDVAIVGAGPGGVYAAWRLTRELDQNQHICLLERLSRVGGRILSLRNMGPEEDLTIDMGAYRFPEAPMEGYGEFLYAPLTSALVQDKLKIPTKPYEPGTNSTMRIIVDENNENAGYATFVERMFNESLEAGLEAFFDAEVTEISVAAEDGQLELKLANQSRISVKKLVLNLALRPLTRLLYNSDPRLFPHGYPRVLNDVRGMPGIKLYIHYDDAWWRNHLNLTVGDFQVNSTGPHAPPLYGRYHDGHTRKRGASTMYRGFLEAVYKIEDYTYDYYSPFQASLYEPYTVLRSDDPASFYLLQMVHDQLVRFHKDKLMEAGVYSAVKGSIPKLAVLSAWGSGDIGFGNAIHYTMENVSVCVPARALRPFGTDFDIYLANEAFGEMRKENGKLSGNHGWAEGSMVMSENVLTKYFGLAPPEWVEADIYDEFVRL